MNKKELLSELIEAERAKLNHLIELELPIQNRRAMDPSGEPARDGCLSVVGAGGGKFSTGRRSFRHSEEVYHQSRYVDRLVEIYMTI